MPNCGKSCENCPSGCNINNGICLNDPVDCLDKSHKGDKCDIPCNQNNINCNTCNRKGVCYSCKDNKFYENNCGKSCENCPSGCNINNGICLNNPEKCLDLIHKGDRCDIQCDNEFENCDTCFRNGTCISCKNFESHSIYCNASCPSHCSLNTNNKTVCTLEGQCRGCQPFYYGQICEKDCYGCVTGCDNEGYCKDFKCNEGKFGLKCDNNCTCDTNSNNDECGKFSGQCLNCRFGYFGKNCGDTCNYKCRTGLCCIFKGKDLNDVNEDMKLILKTNYKYLNIRKNNTLYKIEIDYNYGFPLILFNQNSELIDCNISNVSTVNNIENTDLNSLTNNAFSSYNFTNYEINGYLVTNEEIILGEEKKKLSINLTIANQIVCKNPKEGEEKPNGVIGLGFFNSISNTWFNKQENDYKKKPEENKEPFPNILSYSLRDNNNIELSFGLMSQEQISYIDKLTYCDVVFINGTDIRGKKMSCNLNGIKISKQYEGLQLNNSKITFSIGEQNSLILNMITYI